MKRKLYYSTILAISILTIASTLVYKQTWDSEKIHSDTYSKNLTWWTPLMQDSPFRKWDDLEIVEIISWWDFKAMLDLSKISEIIDINKIEYNWKRYKDKIWLEVIVSKESPAIVKIVWKAKLNKQDDLLKINVTKTEELISKKEEIQEKKITSSNKASWIKINWEKFNSNINNLLIMSWNDLDNISHVLIWEKNMRIIKQDSKIYIPIDKKTFTSWEYFMMLQYPDWSVTSLDKKISFTFSQNEINISAITPDQITNDSDIYVVLQGNWFNKLISLQLSNNIIIKNTEFKPINDNVVAVKIPKWIQSWIYKINLMDTKWIYSTEDIVLSINHR